MPTLSVWETLAFTANLRLPAAFSKADKEALMAESLRNMGLVKVKNSQVRPPLPAARTCLLVGPCMQRLVAARTNRTDVVHARYTSLQNCFTGSVDAPDITNSALLYQVHVGLDINL